MRGDCPDQVRIVSAPTRVSSATLRSGEVSGVSGAVGGVRSPRSLSARTMRPEPCRPALSVAVVALTFPHGERESARGHAATIQPVPGRWDPTQRPGARNGHPSWRVDRVP